MAKNSEDQYTKQQVRRRFDAILRGAFAGSPTPLKDIPKKSGESRKTRRKPNEPKSA